MTYKTKSSRPRVARGDFRARYILGVPKRVIPRLWKKEKKEKKKKKKEKATADNSISPIKDKVEGDDSWCRRFRDTTRHGSWSREETRQRDDRTGPKDWMSIDARTTVTKGLRHPRLLSPAPREIPRVCAWPDTRWSACRKVHYITTLGVATFPS